MNLKVLDQIPVWYHARYRGSLTKVHVDQACAWARRALRQTRRRSERELCGRGFVIRVQELCFAGVVLRAKLDTHRKELLIDPNAEADLHEAMERLGFPVHPSARALILAHEVFHLFCPKCPEEIAEMAAHLYVSECLGLEYFPGILDISILDEMTA